MNVSKFYSSSKGESLKRRLEKAHTNVKIKRTHDILLQQKDNVLMHDSVPLIYRVFQKQSEALDFATSFHYSTFAIEHDCQGKRHFMTCHPQTFWKWLKAKPTEDRHAYEVIGQDAPSKVYFDIEYKYQEEAYIKGECLLESFKTALIEDLKVSFSKVITDCSVIDLDSSTSEKFSHHLIVNMTNEEGEPVFFVDNRNVGFYVKKFLDQKEVRNLVSLPSGKTFVDEAVYSKNRNFRTLLSSKFGKGVTLKAAMVDNPPQEDFFFKVNNPYFSLILRCDAVKEEIELQSRKFPIDSLFLSQDQSKMQFTPKRKSKIALERESRKQFRIFIIKLPVQAN